MLRLYERYRDSLRSEFMGKQSAKRLLTIVEDLISNTTPGSFARTFNSDKVFILQLGANAHGSFVMISKLVHGCWKGFIVVSLWCRKENWVVVGGGLDFIYKRLLLLRHLQPKLPSHSVLKPSVVQKFWQKNPKSFLLAVAEGDWRDDGGGKKVGV